MSIFVWCSLIAGFSHQVLTSEIFQFYTLEQLKKDNPQIVTMTDRAVGQYF